MTRTHILGCVAAMLLTGTAANAQTDMNQTDSNRAGNYQDDYASAPPPPSAQSNDDMQCRRQAARQTGYTASSRPDSDVGQRYSAAYEGCMEASNGGPPPNEYAYGPPPPPYYADPYAYPPPYPYAYPYPAYGGPVVSFGFGFGGHRHWR